MEEWQKRYYRAVLDFVGASDGVDLETVVIHTDWNEAGGYSEYTNWDAEIAMSVDWTGPAVEQDGFIKARPEQRKYSMLRNEEVARLIRSFT